MPEMVGLHLDGVARRVPAGTSVAAALANLGVRTLRRSLTGEPRGALCGMGICHECCVTIDGRPHVRACQVECAEGMRVETGRA